MMITVTYALRLPLERIAPERGDLSKQTQVRDFASSTAWVALNLWHGGKLEAHCQWHNIASSVTFLAQVPAIAVVVVTTTIATMVVPGSPRRVADWAPLVTTVTPAHARGGRHLLLPLRSVARPRGYCSGRG